MKQLTLSLALIVAGAFAVSGPVLAIAPTPSLFTVSIAPDGSGNVVASGIGDVNLSNLSFFGTQAAPANGVYPSLGYVDLGNGSLDTYQGLSGPSSFGPGGLTNYSTTSGDSFLVYDLDDALGVPTGYLSGTPLSDSATWSSTTLADLGLTPGTYTYTWASGSVVVDVDASAPSVPEPSQYGLFVFLVTGAFFAWRKFSPRRLSA